MSTESDEQRRCLDDAAYLLGALPPEERASYEEHLRDCPACGQSVAELAGLPGLLRTVPVEVAWTLDDAAEAGPDADALPAGLLPRVLAEAGEKRRRHRHRPTLLAAAAAAVLVGGAVVIGIRDDAEPAPPVTRVVALEQVRDVPLEVTAQLTAVAWGTRIELLCSYTGDGGSAYRVPPEYVLVVRTTRGEEEQVASWRAVPGREVTIEAGTALAPGRISSLEVRTPSGDPVLTSPG